MPQDHPAPNTLHSHSAPTHLHPTPRPSQPVATTCGHFFCSSCIHTSFKSTPLCPICSKNTAGIFNAARKLAAYAKKNGGFNELFKAKSSDEENAEAEAREADKVARDAAAGGEGGGAKKAPKEAAQGAWGVVDEEEGEEEGVAELLEVEAAAAAEKEEAEAKARAEEEEKEAEKEKETGSATTNGDGEDLAAAAACGWSQVAHPTTGQQYWYNQQLNQTCWSYPAHAIKVAQEAAAAAGEAAEVKDVSAPADGELQGNAGARGIGSVWKPLKDGQGRTYYYNTVTGETSWVPR